MVICTKLVTPAYAGVPLLQEPLRTSGIPAFAGMTDQIAEKEPSLSPAR